jgi:hypothetical protein
MTALRRNVLGPLLAVNSRSWRACPTLHRPRRGNPRCRWRAMPPLASAAAARVLPFAPAPRASICPPCLAFPTRGAKRGPLPPRHGMACAQAGSGLFGVQRAPTPASKRVKWCQLRQRDTLRRENYRTHPAVPCRIRRRCFTGSPTERRLRPLLFPKHIRPRKNRLPPIFTFFDRA